MKMVHAFCCSLIKTQIGDFESVHGRLAVYTHSAWKMVGGAINSPDSQEVSFHQGDHEPIQIPVSLCGSLGFDTRLRRSPTEYPQSLLILCGAWAYVDQIGSLG
jgi:hypothetical protein